MHIKYKTIIDNFIRWGECSEKVYAAIVIGSQAREYNQADEYSDLDLIMFVDDPDYFVYSDKWLEEIGGFHISFLEDTFVGSKERRVLFDGALDVDFIPISKDAAYDAINAVESILARGYKIIIDKIGLRDMIPVSCNHTCGLPSENEFVNLVGDFWYHTVWTVKKLKRGELWAAKSCADGYMKHKLLTMIEYHTRALRGADYDTWHNGRFIEEWADRRIIEMLPKCFSRYDNADIKSALLSSMDLFRLTAVETAEKLGFQYPVKADEYASAWVEES